MVGLLTTITGLSPMLFVHEVKTLAPQIKMAASIQLIIAFIILIFLVIDVNYAPSGERVLPLRWQRYNKFPKRTSISGIFFKIRGIIPVRRKYLAGNKPRGYSSYNL